jgi:hypothetical protein
MGAVSWICPKLTIFAPNLKIMIFSRNFFNKIDAWNSYLGDASVKKHPPLSGLFWRWIRCLYCELEVIIACSEGGNFLSRCHFIAERKPPVRNVNKNKNKADHSSSYLTVSPCCFPAKSPPAHCCIFNILMQTEVTFLDSERSHFVTYVLYV